MKNIGKQIKGRRARHFVDIPWLRAVKSWNKQAKHQKHKNGQAYLSSFLSPTFLHLHRFPLHLLSLLFSCFVLCSFIFSHLSPNFNYFWCPCSSCLFYFVILFLSWVICSSPFSLVLFSLFIVPQYSNKPETIKTTNAPKHRNTGILAFPCPCQCLLKHFLGFAPFFFFWFCLFDVCFVCFWFHVFLLFSKQSLCFGLLLISDFFFFWGFKGQVRWPEGPPHLALNPLYICCRKRIPSNLSLLEVKFGCLEVTRFYF